MKLLFYLLFFVFPFCMKGQTIEKYTYKISFDSTIKMDAEETKAWIQKFTHADFLSLNETEHSVYVETAKPINKNVVQHKLIKVNIPVIEIIDFENKKPSELTAEQKEKLKQELEDKVKELESKIK
ncbi:MAG TPA: hypothetical protein PK431_03885 [Chitinophagales bacterium]|nr:hypothetical protein [Chitinophagales bacterium]